MNAPPWPSNPSIGDWFANWVWSGSQWVASPTTGMRVVVQTFKASGSYTPSPGLVSLAVECVGGGGAGGAAEVAYSGVALALNMAGGGGGSGQYARKTLPAALVRGGVPVTIGAGGVPVATPDAGNGGATSFGALCVAGGGGGGYSNAVSGNDSGITQIGGWGYGGSGGSSGIGDLTPEGNAGWDGPYEYRTASTAIQSVIAPGKGAPSAFGGSPLSRIAYQGGHAGQDAPSNTGAGGSGAAASSANGMSGPYVGGRGGSGVCIVTEYCWGDVDQPDRRPPLDVNVHWPRPPWPPGPWHPDWRPPPGPWPRSEDDP